MFTKKDFIKFNTVTVVKHFPDFDKNGNGENLNYIFLGFD